MNNNTNLAASFKKLVAANFVNYNGVLLEKLPNGYKCMGVFCLNLSDVDRVLNSGRSALSKSISNSLTPTKPKEDIV